MSPAFFALAFTAAFSAIVFSPAARASAVLSFRETPAPSTETSIRRALNANYDLEKFREARVQFSRSLRDTPERAVIYLISKDTHRLEVAAAHLDRQGHVVSLERDYQTQESDRAPLARPRCPDESVEFIAFAPVDHELEQRITNEVADHAQARGLKTVRLLKKSATRQAYLDYMSCPNLKGNFYDGDSNPKEFVTYDGTISADEMSTLLGGAFRFRVTNIWLACRAFNPPMLPALVDSAQSQKYAAGLNDLIVGPSDEAAACAMKAAIDGRPMQTAFGECYDKYDTPADKWGFDGKGSDSFGR